MLLLKTPAIRPRFNQRSVHSEMFVREQPLFRLLQQQGPQQLLRSNRWPSHARIQLREQRRHRLQRRVSHPSYPSQRMILRYPLLRRNVTEHATLLLIVSAHVLLAAPPPAPVPQPTTFPPACKAPPLQKRG